VHVVRPIWLTDVQPELADRFLQADASSPPAPEDLNPALPGRLEFARHHILTHRTVADRIVEDSALRRYRTVVLLLVDGLGYHDTVSWPEYVEPCLVDGPSITYYRIKGSGDIVPEVGFPGIVGTPRLARRLIDAGLSHSYGFSYWSREQNDVSQFLFEGIPVTRVVSFSEVLSVIRNINLEQTYVQVVREGLDGVAHRRREVTTADVDAAVQAIRADVLSLFDELQTRPRPIAVYLTADHGILWKAQHSLEMLQTENRAHPRYATTAPHEQDKSTRFAFDKQTFYLYHYPYIGAPIRRNDSGVHGGLSAQESLVPFIRWELL